MKVLDLGEEEKSTLASTVNRNTILTDIKGTSLLRIGNKTHFCMDFYESLFAS